ncbi:MAG: F0F1 ATP synthase subunit epsilon [Elusimicrobia bacterium]|nr:F0F1 ATP synthase subunit epsilon [Elusimicrobiota bacterium]
MAGPLTLELITPERPAFSGEGDFVVLPAWEGEMGVLPGHAPFLVQLKPGEVRFKAGGETKIFAVSGGFAEIRGDKVSLFAETAEMAESIDAERARQALERAKAELLNKDLDSLTLAQAEAAMRRAQVRLKVAQLRSGRRQA